MTIEELITKRIGVVGLGINNVALVGWLLKHSAQNVTICDQNPTVRLDHPAWVNGVSWRLGDNHLQDLTDFDILIRTPGRPYLSAPIQEAKRAGVLISSQTKLFFDLSPAKIIGVTGTKGKGTTASLIYEILKANSKAHSHAEHASRAFLAGNIGKDPFEFLDQLTSDDWVILELSSFQLQDMEKSPQVAVVLDITSDHLDHHQTRDEYVEAKTPIVRFQRPADAAIINADSATSRTFAQLTKAHVWSFARARTVERGVYVRWSATGPRIGEVVFRDEHGRLFPIVKTTELRLRGEHNLENIGAAIAASYAAGVSVEVIPAVVRAFQGLAHRLELVGQFNRVSYYNDSFATNPEPTIAAVRSFHEPIHLIVGGGTKHADFSELGRIIAQDSNVASLIPLGNAEASRIVAAVEAHRQGSMPAVLPTTFSMEEAVDLAARTAKTGDVVLLSPAATSFDLFHNYKERGDLFRRAAQRLGEQR